MFLIIILEANTKILYLCLKLFSYIRFWSDQRRNFYIATQVWLFFESGTILCVKKENTQSPMHQISQKWTKNSDFLTSSHLYTDIFEQTFNTPIQKESMSYQRNIIYHLLWITLACKNEKGHWDTYLIIASGIYHYLYDHIFGYDHNGSAMELETAGQYHLLRTRGELHCRIYKEKDMSMKGWKISYIMYATTDDGIDTGTATGCDKKSFRTVKEIHQQMVLLSFYFGGLEFFVYFCSNPYIRPLWTVIIKTR